MTRRTFLATAAVTGSAVVTRPVSAAPVRTVGEPTSASVSLTVNGERHELTIDPRVTLLNLLREGLQLTGTKKGCDHGQCGTCTVLADGRRINACLSLAVMHDGEAIVTVEGLARGEALHPVQAAFLADDAFQCGYCTPGQICSAVALLEEVRAGHASSVSDLAQSAPARLGDEEIRERMSGNICRCGAYPNIVAAVRTAARQLI
jgi:xanthine dehydrogenase YagT iron-sulfur-binding subunit